MLKKGELGCSAVYLVLSAHAVRLLAGVTDAPATDAWLRQVKLWPNMIIIPSLTPPTVSFFSFKFNMLVFSYKLNKRVEEYSRFSAKPSQLNK